jgi:hypothetical protein
MIVASDRQGGQVTSWDDSDQIPDGPSPEPFLPAVRPGPAVLDADSWEEHEDPEPIVETYEGRRRAAASTSLRAWVVLAAVLIGLGAVVAIPLALFARRDHSEPAAAETTTASLQASADATTPGTGLVPATGAPARPTTTRPPASTTTTTRTSAAAFSVTLEAEGAALSGSAWATNYDGASGGRIVRNVGNWDGNPGTVKFSVTLPAAGSYVITMWYVHLDGEQTRSAQISVSGADPVTRAFTGSATCCQSGSLPPISLAAGVHTVTIGNPTGHSPSIDKIAIARA